MRNLLAAGGLAGLAACVGDTPVAGPAAPVDAGVEPTPVSPDAAISLADADAPADAEAATDAANLADAGDAGACDPALLSVWSGNRTTQDRAGTNLLDWTNPAHALYAPGKAGDSFDFSSTAAVSPTSAVFREAAIGLNGATQLTVSLWAAPLSGSTAQLGRLFGLAPVPATPETRLQVVLLNAPDPGNSGQVVLAVVANGILEPFPASQRLPQPGVWIHYVVTFASDADATLVRLYIDGQPAGMRSIPGPLPSLANARIGIGGSYTIDDYHGRIDEVALYTRALNAVEVDALYDDVTPPRCR